MSIARRKRLESAMQEASRAQVMHTVLLIQAIAAQTGINPTDLQCLGLLTLEGPMTPSRLAEAMAISKGGAVTAMIDRLEKAGYLQRTRDPRDRRQVMVEPIQGKPLQRLMTHFQPAGQALATVMAHYTDQQLELVTDFIVHSNDAIAKLRHAAHNSQHPDAP